MTTAFSDIVAAFVTALSAAPAVSTSISRAHARQMPESQSTSINVVFEGSDPEDGGITGAPVDWATLVSVECYVRSSTESGDLAVDTLMKTAYARLAADTTLGGLVRDIGSPSIRMDYVSEGQRMALATLTYRVQHRTTALALE